MPHGGCGRVGAGVVLALWILGGAAAPAVAGTTGKISGRVLDEKKQPLPGVNVIVPAAHVGAASDADGRYLILNVPAGTYEVRFNLLGYRAVTVQNVVVSADLGTTLDAQMGESPVEMKEVVVSAKRPVVDLKLTSNLAAVHRDEIKKLPVQDLTDIVNLQAGVVDGHIRGGRVGEVQYQVDGVTINNPYDNKSTLKLDRSLLEEVQVISGTFDAEYGQAMSGVVNAILRRGSERFQWDAEAYGGGFVFPGDRSRPVDFEFKPAGTQSYQGSASGPTVLPKTTFLANGRYYHWDDYVEAQSLFTPWIVRDTSGKVPDPTIYKAQHPDGDFRQEPLGWSREWSGVAKLTNRSIPHLELSYQAIVNRLESRRTDWNYRYLPDGLPITLTRSVVHGLDLTHTVNSTSYYSASLRQNWFDTHTWRFEDVYDPRYDRAGPPKLPTGSPLGWYDQGVDFSRSQQTTNAVVVKGAFVSQWRKDQQLKTGLELQWPHVSFGSPGEVEDLGSQIQRHVSDPPRFPGVLQWRPYTAAAYAQEDLEWNDLRIRAGARFEYFNPRAGLPSDLSNPANSIAPPVPQSHWVASSRKISLSPRIGVSYPVTEHAALFVAYGHFTQLPDLGKIYDHADYSLLADLQASTNDYGRIMGNPDIRPEKTVQYQFGYKQSITDDFGVDVTLFYKDIRDLLGIEFINTYNDAQYVRWTNVDFGNVVGFTLALNRRSFGLLTTTLDYTWQLAKGNSSDPRETADRAAANQDPRPRVIPFNWDQRHTLNLTATVARPDRYVVSGILKVASGQPYTPESSTGLGFGLEANSERKPAAAILDLRAERSLGLAAVPATVFGRVFNVFDAKFNNGFVFATSGSPLYSRFSSSADLVQLGNPTRLYAPRRVEVGVTLRGGGGS